MERVLDAPKVFKPLQIDRPGWIPPEITHDWDPNPYAYQTEEELMPAGGPHGKRLVHMMEQVDHILEESDLMLLMDTFILYRDENNIKQRITPDLMLVDYQDPPPSAYDLDDAAPPFCAVEVTSPKGRLNDLNEKRDFYIGYLGIPTYVVVDQVTASGKLRDEVDLYVWQDIDGEICEIPPDEEGRFFLPAMDMRIMADGQSVRFIDAETGEILFDMKEERAARLAAETRALFAETRAEAEAQRAEAEAQRAEAAETRATAEAQRAEQAELRAEAEAENRRLLEVKLAHLEKLLAQKG